ncbi:hypothetical protein Tco_0806254 [Tanacetum coccineum]
MASTKVYHFKPSKSQKSTIIPPKQLFIGITNDDPKLLSLNYQVLSPSAQNEPLKTPSNIATSSSSIDYKPKSPTSSTSPSTNGYLNSPTYPPPRVPLPPPTQESGGVAAVGVARWRRGGSGDEWVVRLRWQRVMVAAVGRQPEEVEVMMVVVFRWAAVGRQPEERAARGGDMVAGGGGRR